ncbi:MAG: class I SAM-dependent methyltransferase [Nanoarchaeota archaeon]|nr:class I SAM-dependent methyltransferase [Nanoarchaeota archaeon]
MNDKFSTYLSGERLYADDFTIEEIQQWYADEAEGYADLGAKEKDRYRYGYHQLNNQHAFKFIFNTNFNEALGVGSAYGEEFKPIAHNIGRLTILDPSDAFSDVYEIHGTPCRYVKPNPDGRMPFESNKFDLVTSLGVMHHIPNVSYVMSECYRCTNDGGMMLLREPIVSMGDWRKHRKGLTNRERGIPVQILDEIVRNVGFKIAHRSFCNFPLIPKIANKLGVAACNNTALTITDTFLSQIFSWNVKYHRTKLFDKFAPASVYYVLEK